MTEQQVPERWQDSHESAVNCNMCAPCAECREKTQIIEELGQAEAERDQLRLEVERERSGKDTAYSERNRLVCALSKLFPSRLERHPDSDTAWEDDWRWIVFIDTPKGQASWHIHDSELAWFDHLKRTDGNSWDGHSTAEKYARIERFEVIGSLESIVALAAKEQEGSRKSER